MEERVHSQSFSKEGFARDSFRTDDRAIEVK